ncbi:hypothetical protein ACGFIF_38005 [Kribbella sp. NPDC049174]|uniref:hypothetical protein n=1 Tax=Kribbella sp. NPDC049174 TaxID=3364112 RepID=UPI003712C5C9
MRPVRRPHRRLPDVVRAGRVDRDAIDRAHISGSSLSAQARYAAGTREILESWFAGTPIRDEYLIVDGGRLAGAGAHSYST